MRYWGYFLYSEDCSEEWANRPVNVARETIERHRITYGAAKSGDVFIFYPGNLDDLVSVRRDGELVPGTELYGLVMTELLLGRAVAVTL